MNITSHRRLIAELATRNTVKRRLAEHGARRHLGHIRETIPDHLSRLLRSLNADENDNSAGIGVLPAPH